MTNQFSLVACCGLLVFLALAPGPTRADDWAELRGKAATIRTIEADFVQQKELKILVKPLVSKGRFLFSAPDRVRWEYRSPVQVVSLVKGGELRRYTNTEDEGWVLDSSGSVEAMRIVMEKVAGWLTGSFQDDEAFHAELRDGPPTIVVLTPKAAGMDKFIRRVEVTFSSTPGVVETVRIHEGPDAHTTITFENVRLNQEIQGARFEDVE